MANCLHFQGIKSHDIFNHLYRSGEIPQRLENCIQFNEDWTNLREDNWRVLLTAFIGHLNLCFRDLREAVHQSTTDNQTIVNHINSHAESQIKQLQRQIEDREEKMTKNEEINRELEKSVSLWFFLEKHVLLETTLVLFRIKACLL